MNGGCQLCGNLYSRFVPPIVTAAETLSVTQAAQRGVSAIVRAADEGQEIVVERHGRPLAAIVGMQRLEALSELEADLRSAALVLARLAMDYPREGRYGQVFTLHTRAIGIGDKSLTLEQVVHADDKVVCRVEVVMVGFDPATRKSAPVPKHWRLP